MARLAVVDAGSLAENIDAALALGDGAEPGVFLSGLKALGLRSLSGRHVTTTSGDLRALSH